MIYSLMMNILLLRFRFFQRRLIIRKRRIVVKLKYACRYIKCICNFLWFNSSASLISVADVLFYILLFPSSENKIECSVFVRGMQSPNDHFCRNTTGGIGPKALSEEKCCLSEIQAFSLFHLSVLKSSCVIV